MVNYRKFEHLVTIGNITFHIPNTVELMRLHDRTDGSAAADSMNEHGGTNLFAVDAGKRFQIIGVKMYVEGVAGGTLVIYQGDTEDALTLAKITLTIPKLDLMIHEIPFVDNDETLITIAAGKFVVIKPSASLTWTEIYGYQIPA